MGKEEIQKTSIRFATSRNSSKTKHVKSLERRLKNLINKSEEDYSNRIAELSSKLQVYKGEKSETARIKAKIQWRIEGEKCTKFFLNLQKK